MINAMHIIKLQHGVLSHLDHSGLVAKEDFFAEVTVYLLRPKWQEAIHGDTLGGTLQESE